MPFPDSKIESYCWVIFAMIFLAILDSVVLLVFGVLNPSYLEIFASIDLLFYNMFIIPLLAIPMFVLLLASRRATVLGSLFFLGSTFAGWCLNFWIVATIYASV